MRVENESGCRFYGDKIEVASLPRNILNGIGKILDRDKAKKALGIYRNINLSQKLSEPMQFKRVTAYLTYVTLIFFIVSGIYQVKVAPSFLQAFESFELSIPSHLIFYRDYWTYFVLFIFALLAGTLAIGYTLKNLFRFRQGYEHSFILRLPVFKSIRSTYINIIDVLFFPLLNAQGDVSTEKSNIHQHLLDAQNSGMNLTEEMQAIIELQMKKLLAHCEKQMRLISVFIALIIVAAIFFFMVSAYSPLFLLGETV